jgi:hypothetical protein
MPSFSPVRILLLVLQAADGGPGTYVGDHEYSAVVRDLTHRAGTYEFRVTAVNKFGCVCVYCAAHCTYMLQDYNSLLSSTRRFCPFAREIRAHVLPLPLPLPLPRLLHTIKEH